MKLAPHSANFIYANESVHWSECICGLIYGKEAHTPETEGSNICTVCGTIPTGATQSYMDIPVNTNPNFKYHGYFHADGFLNQGSYMAQIGALGNSNVAMINSARSVDVAVARIEEAKANGMQVILTLYGLFGSQYEGKWSGLHYNEDGTGRYEVVRSPLLSNWKDTFATWKSALQPYINDGTILMFYMDEPQWHGIWEEDFRTVTKYVREQCPTIGFMHCMSAADTGAWIPAMVDGNPYPLVKPSYNEYVTDVMYDAYGYWNDAERASMMDKLKATATNNQWIWGCATGFIDHTAKDPLSTEILKASLINMYKEGLKEPRYRGIINFTFAGGDPRAAEFSYAIGTNQYVNVTSEYYSEDIRQYNTLYGNRIMSTPLVAKKDLISSFDDTLELDKVSADGIWNLTIDRTKKQNGFASLKITPTDKDGTPSVQFNHWLGNTWNLTNAHHVTIWAKSSADLTGYALVVKDDNGTTVKNSVTMGTLWMKYSIPVSQMIEAGLDLTSISIEFVYDGVTYTDKVPFYLDDLAIFYVEDETFPTDTSWQSQDFIGLDNDLDLKRAGGTGDDIWCWPRTIDAEVKRSGRASLLVTPHKTDGTWPNVVLYPLQGETWDLTSVTTISIWARNAGNETITGFGLGVFSGDVMLKAVQVDMPVGEWVCFELSLTGTNYTGATIKFGNFGSGYTNRASFNLDDFVITRG